MDSFGFDSIETTDPEAFDTKIKKQIGLLAKVGNIRCYWHDSNGIPRITIGPDWKWSITI